MRIHLNFEEEEMDNLAALDRHNNITNRHVQETDTHSHTQSQIHTHNLSLARKLILFAHYSWK